MQKLCKQFILFIEWQYNDNPRIKKCFIQNLCKTYTNNIKYNGETNKKFVFTYKKLYKIYAKCMQTNFLMGNVKT